MNPYGPQQLASAIRTVRKNTIIVAEDIPEERYGYRITPDSRSVAETLLHIASMPQIDYYAHGSERISAIEDFQLFRAIMKKQPIHEHLPHPHSQNLHFPRTSADTH